MGSLVYGLQKEHYIWYRIAELNSPFIPFLWITWLYFKPATISLFTCRHTRSHKILSWTFQSVTNKTGIPKLAWTPNDVTCIQPLARGYYFPKSTATHGFIQFLHSLFLSTLANMSRVRWFTSRSQGWLIFKTGIRERPVHLHPVLLPVFGCFLWEENGAWRRNPHRSNENMLTAHREKTPASWQKQTKNVFVCESSLHIFKGVHKVGDSHEPNF